MHSEAKRAESKGETEREDIISHINFVWIQRIISFAMHLKHSESITVMNHDRSAISQRQVLRQDHLLAHTYIFRYGPVKF